MCLSLCLGSPTDLTLDTLTVTRLLHGLQPIMLRVQGELTYGFKRNVQVGVQRDMANILSIGSSLGSPHAEYGYSEGQPEGPVLCA